MSEPNYDDHHMEDYKIILEKNNQKLTHSYHVGYDYWDKYDDCAKGDHIIISLDGKCFDKGVSFNVDKKNGGTLYGFFISNSSMEFGLKFDFYDLFDSCHHTGLYRITKETAHKLWDHLPQDEAHKAPHDPGKYIPWKDVKREAEFHFI